MNRNHLVAILVSAAVLSLIAFLGFYFFEVVPVTKNMPPSREARVNEYLAFDRWLTKMGRPIRILKSGDVRSLEKIGEKQIFIQASLFRWTENSLSFFTQWIEEGGDLFLSLDYSGSWHDNEPIQLLKQFGIEANIGTDSPRRYYNSESPAYDYNVYFKTDENFTILKFNDRKE